MWFRQSSRVHAFLVLAVVALIGCQGAYYGTMEKFGIHKRDILVDRVEEARDDQEEAKEEFQDALSRFSAVVSVAGSDLRNHYDALNSQLERCDRKANDVRDRIKSIESVASDLFEEWEAELDVYSSDDLRRRSQTTLEQTQDRYRQLIGAMHRAESKMEPVLSAFNDQVLFLKHNLNAQAVASLQGEVASIEADVALLIAEMNAAIAEANAFIEGMTADGE